jgi:hypothetical protein
MQGLRYCEQIATRSDRLFELFDGCAFSFAV